MTNKHFEIKNFDEENCDNNNFMEGDLKIEIICEKNIYLRLIEKNFIFLY
jgi:hypothetical protein